MVAAGGCFPYFKHEQQVLSFEGLHFNGMVIIQLIAADIKFLGNKTRDLQVSCYIQQFIDRCHVCGIVLIRFIIRDPPGIRFFCQLKGDIFLGNNQPVNFTFFDFNDFRQGVILLVVFFEYKIGAQCKDEQDQN